MGIDLLGDKKYSIGSNTLGKLFVVLQSVTKYLRLQFSCEIAHYGKSLISAFQKIFTSVNKNCILWGGGGARDQAIILSDFKIFLIFPNF